MREVFTERGLIMQSEFSNTTVIKGIALSALASTFWGISGVVTQFISQNLTIPAAWFLSMRTFGAGVTLLLISFLFYGPKKTLGVFKNWKSVGILLAYALIGLAANMGSFYVSIQTGNASATTILQYLAPLFVVAGAFFFKHIRPLRSDLISFLLCLVGVFFALTKGDMTQLAIPMDSLIWGLISAVTAACYVVFPRPLIATGNPPFVVLGWGTLIASIGFNTNHPFWHNHPTVSWQLVVAVAAVILIGTIMSFSTLLYSLRFAPADVVSIMDAVQPIVTSVLSVVFLGLHMTWIETLGVIIVIVAIYILQNSRQKLEKNAKTF